MSQLTCRFNIRISRLTCDLLSLLLLFLQRKIEFLLNFALIFFPFTKALDIAGPLFKGDKFFMLPGFQEGGVSPNVAEKTIAIHTNPGFMGTAHFNKAQVNIEVNPPSFNQPGSESAGPMYNHAFAVMLTGSLCAKTNCFASDNSTTNLNFFYNTNIPASNYKLFAKKCYPFCC